MLERILSNWFYIDFAGTRNQARTPTKTFQERLKDVYNGEIPHLFIDIVNYHLMNKPMMINNNKAATLDESTIASWRKTDKSLLTPGKNTCPFTRQPIVSITENRELTEQIEAWISSLENIKQYEDELQKAAACKIENIEALFEGTEATPDEIAKFKREQESEIQKTCTAIKLKLATELQYFFAITATVIESEDRQLEEKNEEAESILGSYVKKFIQLRHELRFKAPDFYRKTLSHDEVDLFPLKFARFMVTCGVLPADEVGLLWHIPHPKMKHPLYSHPNFLSLFAHVNKHRANEEEEDLEESAEESAEESSTEENRFRGNKQQ